MSSVRPARSRIGRAGEDQSGDERATCGRRTQDAERGRADSSTSFAKIGSSATAPPKSTANRSSEIAPSRTGVRRTSVTPREHAREVGRAGTRAVAAGAKHEDREQRDDARATQRRRRRAPASAREASRRAPGPPMIAACERSRAHRERAHEDLARAPATASASATRASRGLSRPPCTNASTKNGQVSSAPFRVTASRPRATSASIRDREREDRPSREPVGEMARRKREHRQRDEHREADEPEVERVAGGSA